MKIYIDDERPLPAEYTHLATTYEQALGCIAIASGAGLFDLVSFDHDLGGDDTTRGLLTFMIENDVWPNEIRVHTANPVGHDWLIGTAARYAPKWVRVQGR